jgi:hypothetical protein
MESKDQTGPSRVQSLSPSFRFASTEERHSERSEESLSGFDVRTERFFAALRMTKLCFGVASIGGSGRNHRVDHGFRFAFLRCAQGQERSAHGPTIVAPEVHGAFHARDAELPH